MYQFFNIVTKCYFLKKSQKMSRFIAQYEEVVVGNTCFNFPLAAPSYSAKFFCNDVNTLFDGSLDEEGTSFALPTPCIQAENPPPCESSSAMYKKGPDNIVYVVYIILIFLFIF
jgi:hypothetical protein